MANHGPSYGLDAELEAKRKAKYNPQLEAEARSFIESKIGRSLAGDFQENLKDGIALCEMINAIRPGSVKKIERSKMPFKQMENINAYLVAVEKLGLVRSDVFMTVDLFEGKNMNQVVQNILAVKLVTG